MKEGFLLNNLTIRKLQITAPTNRLLTKPPSNRTETALFVLSRFISALDRTKSALLVLSTCKRRLFPSAHLHQSVCLPTTSDAPRALDPQIARRASPLVTRSVQIMPFLPAERHHWFLFACKKRLFRPPSVTKRRSYPRPCTHYRSRHSGHAVILGREGGRPLSRASRTPRPGDNCLHTLRKSPRPGDNCHHKFNQRLPDRETTATTTSANVSGRKTTAATNTTTLPARKLTTITKSTNASHPGDNRHHEAS